jgi:hypothetical protein
MTFLMKGSETKKFKIFCEVLLIIKKYFASTIEDFFHFYKKGFLNSQAVRIRVNVSTHTSDICLLCSNTVYDM